MDNEAQAVTKAMAPGYDMVHANFFMSGRVGLRLKAAFGLPLDALVIGRFFLEK